MITFSPVASVCVPDESVKILVDGAPTEYSLTELVEPSNIRISAEYSVPPTSKYNLSATLAPTLYPWVRTGGTISSEVNPLRYNLVVLFDAS